MSKKLTRALTIRIILFIAIFPYLITFAQTITNLTLNIYGKYYFHKSYIKSINLPTYNTAKTVLEEFNSMGNNKIVSFREIKDGRPIEIIEMSELDTKLIPEAIGVARPKLSKCTISIRRGLSVNNFRETLIHEYLHCYGYVHSSDPKDLMYYSLNPIDKEENIRQYARDMEKRFYE